LTFSGGFPTFDSALRIQSSRRGAVAQLGERLNGIQEVVGSIPIGSTKKCPPEKKFSLNKEFVM
jgi:hypothetical protein